MNYDEMVDWALKGMIAAAFMTWAWVVKNFGERHVVTLGKLEQDIKLLHNLMATMQVEIIREVSEIKVKVAVLEARIKEQ